MPTGPAKGPRGGQGAPKKSPGETKGDPKGVKGNPKGVQGDQKGILGDLFRARWQGGRRQLNIYGLGPWVPFIRVSSSEPLAATGLAAVAEMARPPPGTAWEEPRNSQIDKIVKRPPEVCLKKCADMIQT